MKSCTHHGDCIVLHDSWCGIPDAINQTQLEEWQKIDQTSAKQKEEARQTCKPSMDNQLYYAFCQKNKCAYKAVTLEQAGLLSTDTAAE